MRTQNEYEPAIGDRVRNIGNAAQLTPERWEGEVIAISGGLVTVQCTGRWCGTPRVHKSQIIKLEEQS